MASRKVTVYRVIPSSDFQRLEMKDEEEFRRKRGVWRFDGTPIGKKWASPKVFVPHPSLERPDIWGTFVGWGALAFEPHVADVVQLFLDQAGEQLPLIHEKRRLTMLNVTYVTDCLDTDASESEPDLPHIVNKYVFHAHRLDYSLFKIPQTAMGELLTVEGLSAPDDEFKPTVEKHGFKGLIFNKLWSGKAC